MSFPAYPEYKDSGVVWLGGIPAHWNIKKFRYVFEESPEKITDEVVGDMLSVSGYRGIEVKQYDDEGRRRTDEELFGYRVVRPGQLVVNTMWLNYAGLGVSEHEGHVSPAYRSYWIDPAMDKRFIHHLMRSGTYVQGYTRLLTGIRPNSLQMGRDDLMVFPVLLPTKSEQTQIARFLDHETARIDALIEEQQRLIELLKEKRQAVISHAVTKGLDPTVPMKDSGVEWLGDVPAHWVVSKIGFRARLQGGFAFSADMFTTVGVPVVKMNNLKRGVLELSEAAYVSEEFCDERFALHVGDVLFGMSGSIGPTGSLGNYAVVSECDIPAMLNQRVGRFVLSTEEVHPGFMTCVLCSRHFNEQVQLLVTGTAQFNISSEQVESCLSVFPPVHEQAQIAHFLVQETSRFDTLLSEAENGIALLNERRSALISAAVTGKIDVRGWQPPANTQAPKLEVAEAH
ncbi:restriction endonuclease subunit S [Stutzerimonas stutzeri]|uniref:restriction endonuclease subunit S n=1 Tax=Stutzerimonas stutzeri TaxID=316 RepID=UPI000E9F8A05|nr:restriction endonuclease subunit S [Stutzerimonas stutzeri]TFZ16438.1 restriction endonuclease subunit S [Stutzerimonas stutzeri]HBM64713.1 restriction endonuclease subunit S [Pseudomonas sp.]